MNLNNNLYNSRFYTCINLIFLEKKNKNKELTDPFGVIPENGFLT